MQMFRILAVVALTAFGTLQLSACASAPGNRATGQVIDDSSITARVKSALATDASVGTAVDVNVTTYRGVVQLSGFVDSESVAQRAVAIAKGIDGVQSVKNDLRVTTSSR